MTIEQLQTFIAVVQSGGLRPASKVLNKTQPTLSASLKNLEVSLGVQLLNRDSYRVSLTEPGETLFHRAKQILNSIEDFQQLATYISKGYEPQLRLAIDYFFPWTQLQPILESVKSEFPNTSLSVDFQVLGGTEKKILDGDADLGITPFVQHHSKLESVRLFETLVVPVASAKALDNKDQTSSIKDHLPQIVVKDPSDAEPIPFGAEAEDKVWAVSDHPGKKQLIAEGLGWGYLERSSIRDEIMNSSLIEIDDNQVHSKQINMYQIRSIQKPVGAVGAKVWEKFTDICDASP